MTIEEYEMEFLPELEANWKPLLTWDEWVRRSYQSFMDSVAEQELNMELNQL
ncbi:hypothetical protein NVP1213O_66 [Vibrio phage 1.213.O._10N.222.54.F10]|nr:hypothetical protein NVP1213O_66 [Vibrio phage 1.213.O._10N.222.54.F10]